MSAAWFMSHRIREAMATGGLDPFGSDGGMVEVDETYIGRKAGMEVRKGGAHHKMKVLALIDRNTGRSRAMVVDRVRKEEIEPIVMANVAREARLMTDEANLYTGIGRAFAEHHVVRHGFNEYVRGEAHTNTIEGYFSIFKRGMRGIYQHCAEKHLHRYVAEFNFRYDNRAANGFNDADRANAMIRGAVGKRLTYQRAGIGA